MKRKLVINPLPKIFDVIETDNRPFPPFTTYHCGSLTDLLANGRAHVVCAGALPITKIRQQMDFGTLDDFCEEC